MVASEQKAKYGKRESQIPKNDQTQLKDVAIELYMYIVFYYVVLIFPETIIIESQVKFIIWTKDRHNTHFWPAYINSKPKLYMKHDINILVISSIY